MDWTNPARPKLDGEFVKPKKALVWVAWSVERHRPELLILEQRSLRDGIVEALGDEHFGFNDYGTAGFLLKVSRRGTGLDTSYSVLPKTKAPTKVETNGMSTVSDLTVTSLLDGGHPFVQAAAEFKTEAAAEEAESDGDWVLTPAITSVIADQFFLSPCRVGNKKPEQTARAGDGDQRS